MSGTPSTNAYRRLRDYVLVRHRRNWELLLKFSLVGGSGFVVNLGAYELTHVLVQRGYERVLWPIPGTEYNVYWYHVYSTVAFLVANASNYLLNRSWTFDSRGTAHWLREYLPFLTIGLLAQALVLGINTLLLNDESPLEIDSALLAQLIAIVVVTPVSFAGNKLWTFSHVRERDRGRTAPQQR